MEWIMIFFGIIIVCCLNSIINELKYMKGSQERVRDASEQILRRLPSSSWYSDNLKI